MKTKLFLIFILGNLTCLFSQIPSFPGAEGFGSFSTGGRGGQVIFVDNLNCSGPGSLNEALSTPGNKYIIFRVSGIIDCAAEIVEGNCYIAGQTSPNGIIVRGIIADDYYNPSANPNNLIIRHLRSRGIGTHPTSNYATDPIIISGVENAIIDHCTFSNSDDEAVDISRSRKLSIQNCLLAETVGSHFDLGGMLFNYSTPGNRMDSISIHHNNWNRIGGRMPEFSCEDPSGCTGTIVRIEYSCNLLWDQQRVIYHNIDTDLSNGSDPGFVEPYFLNLNFVNNYGVSRPEYCEAMFLNSFLQTAQNKLYVSGNKQSRYPTFSDYELFNCCNDFCSSGLPNTDLGIAMRLNSRHNFPPITYTNALDLPNYMVNNVGAFPRFPHETRLIESIENNSIHSAELNVNAVDDILLLSSQNLTYPNDSDSDGMPDYWEIQHGLNTNIEDHNQTNLSSTITGVEGYTNLECYLNCLADALVNNQSANCGIVLNNEELVLNNSTFIVYPNPSDGNFIIFSSLINDKIEIKNIEGKLIHTVETLGKSKLQISLAQFVSGIYFVSDGLSTQKIILK
ncbi:MAG: T9SS type A sorting domain-containing protein [Flavobacteriia bacterium]|nr:T9SS type A sorting domain-containing protein [Flavobacteriia bacterium]